MVFTVATSVASVATAWIGEFLVYTCIVEAIVNSIWLSCWIRLLSTFISDFHFALILCLIL